MNLQEKHKIRILLLIGLVLALFFWFTVDYIFQIKVDTPTNITLPTNSFTQFAIAISVINEMIPSVAKQFYSSSMISSKLLLQGFSPLLLGFILALGQLVGQMALYIVGIFVRHVHKGNFGNMASGNHFFHQHHFLIYLGVPFTGVLGDFGMIYSGHERINPIKIIPFLFASNLLYQYKWIYTQIFNTQLSDSLS